MDSGGVPLTPLFSLQSLSTLISTGLRMKVIRFHEHGDADVLKLEDVPVPDPAPGTVRIHQEVIGVNYIDTYHRKGLYKVALPYTPGQEGAGVVDAVGEGVSDLKPGDAVVYGLQGGAYAEYNVVPAEKVVKIPVGVDPKLAVALFVQGITAQFLAFDTFPLKPGHTALIHAAAGGVGLLLVQIAKRRGARVIGTTSTEEKAQLVKQAGADEVLLYENFEAETKRLTEGKGVDVVYDSVGKDTFDRSLNCLRPRGYLVLFGQSSGPVPPVDPQTLAAKGSLFLTRPTMGSYILTRDELLSRSRDVFGWVTDKTLSVRIDRMYPLAQAADAHRALESRETKGKVLLTV
jgi:NADPH:quinone reductase